MANLRHNVISNFVGKAWSVLLSLAVVPLYLRLLGVEAYGLVGVFVTLTGIVAVFDFGLGTALSRELARYSTAPGNVRDMRNLLRTLETVYWLIGILIALVLALAAPSLAQHWIKAQALTPEMVQRTLLLISIAIACMWPRSLYANGLVGVQRQVALNILACAMATLQNVGGVFVVWQIGTIEALVAWYAAVGLLDSLLSGYLLWRAMPSSTPAQFDSKLLRKIGRFATGMAAISALSVVLTQLDKVILSNVLTLEAFAYYMLAWRVVGGIQYLVTPITSTFFPRFSQLAIERNETELARLYHRSCQLLSVVVIPVAVVIAVFPREFLLLWTHDVAVAENAKVVLTILVAATALNGLMGLPLMLQLAYGSTRLIVIANAVAVVVLAPLIYVASVRHGAIGAATVWFVLNLSYVLVLVRLMHRSVLIGELRPWIFRDVGVPLLATAAIGLAWKMLLPVAQSYSMMVVHLVVGVIFCFVAAALAAPQPRGILREHVLRSVGIHA